LDLAAGFQQRGYVVEPDRKKAIQLAVLASRPGDTVLIAGKGDETYQIIKESIVPFDDRAEARATLSALARMSQKEHQTDSLGKGP
jgi:UDP-N-acetylmuramyl tripeptide synthase